MGAPISGEFLASFTADRPTLGECHTRPPTSADMNEADRRLMGRGRAQHGLVTRAQALEAGLSASGWRRRVANGQLVLLHPRVARYAATPVTDEQRALAAVLASPPGTLASHTAAAHLWGVDLSMWQPEVIVRRTGPWCLPGVVVHRPTDVADLQPVRRSRVPATTPLRTIVDLAAVAPAADVDAALDHFLVGRTVTLAGVRAALERHSGRGRAGAGALRRVLGRWALGQGVADSEFELVVSSLLARHGLPEPVFHHRIGRYEVDIAFPEALVAVEVDGWATHGRRAAFEQDRGRDLDLAARGWQVVRLTWWAVTNRPQRCFGRLREVLQLRSAA
jgi:very-short-patch-repair endonuclease